MKFQKVIMNKELILLWLSKIVIALFGKSTSHRVLRILYNNLSKKIKGRLINTNYFFETEILVNTKDIIGWKIFFFGQYEASTNRLLQKIVGNNQIVIEAGANIGSETLLLSKLNPDGEIFAFEPAPIPFNLLQFNIGHNQLKNIRFFQEAVGEKEGQLKLHLLPHDFPNQGLTSIKEHSQSNGSINVPLTTIDLIADKYGLENLNLLKMDVQGAEFLILKGASESINAYKPRILLEASSEFLNLREIYNYLRTMGYLIYAFDDKKILEVTENHLHEGNWICFYHHDQFVYQLIEEW